MPIRPENRARYPKDWQRISARIRFDRGEGRCECRGECGLNHDDKDGDRCEARHGKPHPRTGSIVVLTCAHLSEEVEDCSDENLRGFCQQCHNRYDSAMRRRNAATTKERERLRILAKAGQLQFEIECFGPLPAGPAQK
jgi:hypothetical protein